MKKSLVLGSLATLLAAACATTLELKAGDPVPYPDGYRDWTHVRSMLIQPGHPLFDSFGGIHHIYANEPARDALERGDGLYPDGAVFVFDLLEANSADAAVTEGARKVLGVMHKDRGAFGSTGGWGFAGFGGDSRNNVVADARTSCFQCHAEHEDTGFVFSTWRR